MTRPYPDLSPQILEDLLSLYLAGEASDDTKSFVEAYLEADPDLAQRVARSRELTLPDTEIDPHEKEREMHSIERTKKTLRLQSWLFGLAIFFTATLFSFGSFDERGLHWIVLGTKSWPLYAIGAGICWLSWLLTRLRHA